MRLGDLKLSLVKRGKEMHDHIDFLKTKVAISKCVLGQSGQYLGVGTDTGVGVVAWNPKLDILMYIGKNYTQTNNLKVVLIDYALQTGCCRCPWGRLRVCSWRWRQEVLLFL